MNNLFETKSAYNKSVKTIQDQITSLMTVVEMMPAQEKHIMPIIQEKQVLLEMVEKPKTWNFNFVGGGWNSISALTKEEAIKAAIEKYNETEQRYHSPENGGGAIPLTKVDEKTFRVATEADTKNLLSMFY